MIGKLFCMKTISLRWLVVAVIIFLPYTSFASDAYPTGKAEAGKFTVEYVYNFVSKPYTPEVLFEPVSKKNASYSSPEESFIAQFSAMANEDYKWWISGWNEQSQKEIEARNKQMKRNADSWTKVWKGAMKGQTIKLIQKIETGPYVLINYKMFDHDGKETLNSLFVCKNEAGKWLATEELSTDLMFHHFLKGEARIVLNVR